jgi:hypothetical protein
VAVDRAVADIEAEQRVAVDKAVADIEAEQRVAVVAGRAVVQGMVSLSVVLKQTLRKCHTLDTPWHHPVKRDDCKRSSSAQDTIVS